LGDIFSSTPGKDWGVIPAMQTLNLSDSMPRSEGRIKSLLWPSIQSSSDVDYLGAQGYWVCVAVAVLSFVVLIISDHPVMGTFVLLFYYLGGVGVRERSRYAAGCVSVAYLADMLASGAGIVRIILAALLLSNFRATWLAARWTPGSEEATPIPRWSETWTDKFADKLPTLLWPKVRILYYILSACYLILSVIGLSILIHRRIG
jgi:hypothetical protein